MASGGGVELGVTSLLLGQRGGHDLSLGPDKVGGLSALALVLNSVRQCVSAQPEKLTFWYFTLGVLLRNL